MVDKLGTDDSFPNVTLDLVNGDPVEAPGGLGGKYQVILFYRGHW